MKVDELVILVGGKGTRLGKITKRIPKPLIKIGNRTFLDQLLSKIIRYNFKKIYLLCSYQKRKFFKKYHKYKIHNSEIICIDEGKPKGTGGALYSLKNKIKKNFVMINGDTFFDVDYNIIKNQKIKNKSAFIALTSRRKSKNNSLLNNLSLKSKNIFIAKTKTDLMNGGIYLLNKEILKKINNKFLSFENDILNKEILKNKVIGKYFNNDFVDIGSKEKLSYIKNNNFILKNKCFFLDRDGVINKDIGYITNFNKFIFLKGVHKAIKYLNQKRFLVILITNQAAIGKKLLTEKKLNLIHLKMKNKLFSINRSIIDDIYFSPYFNNSKNYKYRINKFDRKPYPGMFLKAIKKWNINIKSSAFIGDKMTDKIAAKKCNVKFYFKKNLSLYKQIKGII
jgi:D-glycero-D-manno-heptose 1,7-bisphosphate phosphatase